jgi:hypothetical protein
MKFSFSLPIIGGVLSLAQSGHSKGGEAHSHLCPPVDLRCMSRVKPLAVLTATPDLSWRVATSSPTTHGVCQSSYEIRISDAARDASAGSRILWDGSKVSSSQSSVSMNAYSGPAFFAGSRLHTASAGLRRSRPGNASV